jgi:creatinine amidohydrolase
MDSIQERINQQFGDQWGHAGEYETSMIENYEPDLVHDEKKEPPTHRQDFKTRPVRHIEESASEVRLGDPTNSDPELIEESIG